MDTNPNITDESELVVDVILYDDEPETDELDTDFPEEDDDGLRAYVGCKIILAAPMTRNEFNKMVGNPISQDEDQEGYMVNYPDGYLSWSPKSVFEQAYREVSNDEKSLLQ